MHSFSQWPLHDGVIKFLDERNYERPSAIQALSIPTLCVHKGDFIGQSDTGTGKTIAFGAPLLTNIDTKNNVLQAVILVPTRELCIQVTEELKQLGTYVEGLSIAAIYGGIPIKNQTKLFSAPVHIIVATPGRLADHIHRNVIGLGQLSFLVFDEADELLSKGFSSEIEEIIQKVPADARRWLFSATLSLNVRKIINRYLKNDVKEVSAEKKNYEKGLLIHKYMVVSPEEKLDVLLHLLSQWKNQKTIIFCRTKSGVQKLYKQLSANKFKSGAVHGDLPQGLRTKVMDQYRASYIDILVATDVAARGIDVNNIGLVIHYHVAETEESYIHRSGRTSRAGKDGRSISFVFKEEKEKFDQMVKSLALDITIIMPPNENDQMSNKAVLWAKKIAKTKPLGANVDQHSQRAFYDELKHLSKEELMAKLLSLYMKEQ